MSHAHSDGRAARGHVLVTGGAGFIGTNLADRLARAGRTVVVLDNLARPGVADNLDWLCRTHGDAVAFADSDVRDRDAVRDAAAGASAVYHFAAQVAVTTSLTNPAADFEVNAGGTINVLEALRPLGGDAPPLLYTSTNKVYGDLADLGLRLTDDADGGRYEPDDAAVRENGVGEGRPLDFHSPYGCSKGAADQYVLDYARSYGLRACCFRMSCIYGPHQCGTADQGWVAHFARAALAGEPVTLYGDGRQVRDVLYVGDLVDAMLAAETAMAAGEANVIARAFNVGGGPGNAVTLLQVLRHIGRAVGREVPVDFGPWRTGDQRYYVSDPSRLRDAIGWGPTTGVGAGVGNLLDWLRAGTATAPPAARTRERATA